MKADQIRHLRRTIGLRQIELATLARMDQARMSRIENALVEATAEELQHIEAALLKEIGKQQQRLADLVSAIANPAEA